ncbi:MAG: acetyl-CoA hydrolase/transferase C-terminal domain-containing protein [Bdellovibrio sp.]
MNPTASSHPPHFVSHQEALNYILSKEEPELRIAAPLGLGKPNELLNAIYAHIKSQPEKKLELYTALSLQRPEAHRDLEKRLLNSFVERHFGENYPDLIYVKDRQQNQVPAHIKIHEFYFQAGQNKNSPSAQQDYVSLNYTHVAPFLLERNLTWIVQLVAKKRIGDRDLYSLSCNPDLTLDVVELYKKQGKNLRVIGVIHPHLPFVGEDAVVEASFFEALVEDPQIHPQLFAIPRTPVKPTDHMIGLHASRLVEDGGTLQIGIGSLSDALVHSLHIRHQSPEHYRNLISQWPALSSTDSSLPLHEEPFDSGLYGTSEMVMDGFMHLRKANILKRVVHEEKKETPTYLHGAFILGSKALYEWLHALSEKDFSGINMTRVSKVNDLYDANEKALRRQRKKARFFNTCMNVTLLGAAASDTLPNGHVISGVGGQYNFVAMSYELPDARSVLMLRSTRFERNKKVSNIVWSHGQLTIPRHLRDVVITEYGIADLKGKTDEEVIKALLQIADSDFQESLRREAVKNGKLDPSYRIPSQARHNTPQRLREWMNSVSFQTHFPAFPFGSDFTPEEERLVLALGYLQKASTSPRALWKIFKRGFAKAEDSCQSCLQRMKLKTIRNPKEWLYQKLVRGALLLTKDER